MRYDEVPVLSVEEIIRSKQVTQLVRDRAEYSRDESTSIRRKVNNWYDLYRGYIRTRSQPFRNQVHLPLLFSSIEVGIAIKHGLLTGQKPWVEFVPSGPEDAMSARRATSLIQQQMEDAHVDSKLGTIMRMGDITGTAPYQWSWRVDRNTRPQRIPVGMGGPIAPGQAPLGQAYEVITLQVTDFDGPWLDVIDILDWFPEPARTNVNELRWCIRRYWMDYDDILRLAADGVFERGGVEDLRQTQMGDETSNEFENRRTAPGGIRWTQSSLSRLDRYAKPVEILEMHGFVPDEMVPEDGARNRLITIGNGTSLLRNVPNPMWSGGIPFGVYSPTPDPYSIYGIGKIEPNDKLQATASRLASQKLDAIDLIIDPTFAYDQLANVQTSKLFARPGGLVGGDGPPQNWLMPVIPDLKGLQQGMVEIETLWRWMQFGTGITEEAIGMGSGSSDRQTAREFLGKMENVQRRMVREALHAADTVLIPLAESFRALNAQFMTFPALIRKLGMNAIIDPVTGAPIPPDDTVSLQDVILKYDMRAASAASLIGRSAKQQNWMLLLQTFGPPLSNPLINWQTVYRETFRVFEQNNPDDFLMPMTPEQMMLFRMAQMMSGMPTSSPSDSGGKSSSPDSTPSTPNSDTMDQMVDQTPGVDAGALGER